MTQLSAKQQAQMKNRDESGQWKQKSHAEPDDTVSTLGIGENGSMNQATETAASTLRSQLGDDVEVELHGDEIIAIGEPGEDDQAPLALVNTGESSWEILDPEVRGEVVATVGGPTPEATRNRAVAQAATRYRLKTETPDISELPAEQQDTARRAFSTVAAGYDDPAHAEHRRAGYQSVLNHLRNNPEADDIDASAEAMSQIGEQVYGKHTDPEAAYMRRFG